MKFGGLLVFIWEHLKLFEILLDPFRVLRALLGPLAHMGPLGTFSGDILGHGILVLDVGELGWIHQA